MEPRPISLDGVRLCDLAIKTNFVGNLTGFVDYNPSIVGQLCILKVITPTLFYFVHYNHQFGANADTPENGNKVMVATTGTSGSFSDLQSFVVAVLDSTRPTFRFQSWRWHNGHDYLCWHH
jgi:hypothetical protein